MSVIAERAERAFGSVDRAVAVSVAASGGAVADSVTPVTELVAVPISTIAQPGMLTMVVLSSAMALLNVPTKTLALPI